MSKIGAYHLLFHRPFWNGWLYLIQGFGLINNNQLKSDTLQRV